MSGVASLLCKGKWRVQIAVTPAMACAAAASQDKRAQGSSGLWCVLHAAVSPSEMVTVGIHLSVQLGTNVTKMD